MYKLLLISKYLRRKLAPLFAALAVLVCTAMVIIVSSVMGGFLETWREAARRVTGDVTVFSDYTGSPYYDEFAAELEALDEVDAAAPIVYGMGMVKIGEVVRLANAVAGIRPDEINEVLPFEKSLYWKEFGEHRLDELAMTLQLPPELRPIDSAGRDVQGAIVGIAMFNYRSQNKYELYAGAVGHRMTVIVPAVTETGTTYATNTGEFVVLNEVKSGMADVDATHVYLPFDRMQQLMGLEPTPRYDFNTGEQLEGMNPGRASAIVVRGNRNYTLDDVRKAVERTRIAFNAQHRDARWFRSQTWEEEHAQILSAVENEKGMMTFLFAIISIVAVVMIATTFYMIVLEKTRDIGVLRAIGASRTGIANVFLGYGIVIGAIGAVLGIALGVTVVFNLNAIENVIFEISGWRMWNPEIYYFDRIPESVEWNEIAVIAVGAVLSSLLGAVIPALLAARLDPVESLRYE